jgi:hypothetical protein
VEIAVQKIRASETNENRVNVAVQIKKVIPAMMARVGTTAFGPPEEARTGKEVRTITRLRRADLRTMLRRLDAGDTFSLPGTIAGFNVGEYMVNSVQEQARWSSFPHLIRETDPSDRISTLPFVRYPPVADHPTIDLPCNPLLNPCYPLARSLDRDIRREGRRWG